MTTRDTSLIGGESSRKSPETNSEKSPNTLLLCLIVFLAINRNRSPVLIENKKVIYPTKEWLVEQKLLFWIGTILVFYIFKQTSNTEKTEILENLNLQRISILFNLNDLLKELNTLEGFSLEEKESPSFANINLTFSSRSLLEFFLVKLGFTNKQISKALNISEQSVKTSVENAYSELKKLCIETLDDTQKQFLSVIIDQLIDHLMKFLNSNNLIQRKGKTTEGYSDAELEIITLRLLGFGSKYIYYYIQNFLIEIWKSQNTIKAQLSKFWTKYPEVLEKLLEKFSETGHLNSALEALPVLQNDSLFTSLLGNDCKSQ